MNYLRVFLGYLVMVFLSCLPGGCQRTPAEPVSVIAENDSIPDTCTAPVCYPDPGKPKGHP